ncbi:MAG: hypothetical protein B6I20_04445 [Bacteroidetes bacterium 4572_117]|nr:MAG: hypothetical protein B6I20_04445 [Bacteroidetes bacterium 4572_117]
MTNTSKKIRILKVVFDTEIKAYEIPAFRGAIVKKVGFENILFHNHLNSNGYLYKYPLIQYKIINRQPAIICVDYGVDEIHKFFENQDWSIKISDRWLNMKIDSLNMNQFTMNIWDKMFGYNIKNWIALNTENYQKYNEFDGIVEQTQFLEKKLVGNILSFAKGIEWTVDKPIKLNITKLIDTRPVTLKKQKMMGFNLDFKCNVFIPNYIGLGKSVSLGYGNVREVRRN